MDWSEFLSDVRNDLRDTGVSPRWSDDLLYLYAKDGIRTYSLWFPKRTDRAAIARQGESYPLPADYIETIYVECPKDTYLEERRVRPGTRLNSSSIVTSYFIQGGSVYLNSPTDEGILLTYHAAHPVPATKDDSEFLFTLPVTDTELIRTFVKARAYGQMRNRQAALDRFKPTGKRDDNPLEPEVEDLMQSFYDGIAERIPGGVVVLYRMGRMR